MGVSRKVKIGIVGLGAIGGGHLRRLSQMDSVEIVGICDVFKDKADEKGELFKVPVYYNHHDLFEKSGLEAVVIAVPHFDHPTISIDAFAKGIHVLCEKPLAVHINDAKKALEAYEKAKEKNPNLIFAIMFQERTFPFHRKIKEIVDSGELGRLIRASWINTQWFRSQLYYDSGDWRATWAGEGGGILTNQCPHNLDLYQWLFGVPSRINGFAHIGKYHDIEVEDEVTGYFEHDNGMVGHFVVTTAESPGTNRMEVVGENGRLVYENEKLLYYKTSLSMLKYIKESQTRMGNVDSECVEMEVDKDAPHGHGIVTEKFIAAIVNGGGELIAHGAEGMNGLTIANALMLSSFNDQTIRLPLDSDEFERKLNELIKTSKYVKKVFN